MAATMVARGDAKRRTLLLLVLLAALGDARKRPLVCNDRMLINLCQNVMFLKQQFGHVANSITYNVIISSKSLLDVTRLKQRYTLEL